jgi:gas vesicle protein
MKKILTKNWLIILVIIVLFTFSYITVDAVYQTTLNRHIDFSFANNYGVLIGGIFSFISVLLIAITLKNQSKVNQTSQFENKFFEQLKYYRENIEELDYSEQNKKVCKRSVFLKIHNEIVDMFEKLKDQYMDYSIADLLNNEQILELQKLYKLKQVKIEKKVFLLSNLSYLIVFFGYKDSNEKYKNALKKALSKDFKSEFIIEFVDYIGDPPTYIDGQIFRLGHYFRHFYQTVRYVNEQSFLTYRQKYQYIKTLRAQMSSYEQSVLFFNSLTFMGRIWDYDSKGKNNKEIINNMYLTKYNLVKNIPTDFILPFNISDFYPNIVYEGDEKWPERIKLESMYK